MTTLPEINFDMLSQDGFEISKTYLTDGDNGADSALRLDFANGYSLILQDSDPGCCETRYLTCDDDLSGLIGDRLASTQVRHVTGPVSDEDGRPTYSHEISFLYVQTQRWVVVLSMHNEHNGWYSGFHIHATLLNPAGVEVAVTYLD